MTLLRSARDNDPALAIALAREGNRRFPGSSDAPERGSILIHALAEQGLSSEARGEAEDMVNRYPDSAWYTKSSNSRVHAGTVTFALARTVSFAT